MEIEIDAPTAQPSLLLLNEYCLLEIFEFLDVKYAINVAKTCNYLRLVVDRTFKKHSKFQLDSMLYQKGAAYVECLFEHIGEHVKSLNFDYRGCRRHLPIILGKISSNCKKLKKLKLSHYRHGLCDGKGKPVYRFDNVEQLTLYECGDKFTEDFTTYFFKSFHILKFLNIGRSSIESNELKTVFRNNRGIESFVFAFNERSFNCKLLQLIPNVQRLWLTGFFHPGNNILELDSLLKLNRLTKLRLQGNFKNLNVFLRKLAEKGILEEMHLEVKVDDDLFDSLTSFSKLRLLVIESNLWLKMKSSIAWPAELKKLRLRQFKLIEPDLISMIQQLKSIESIDIGFTIAENDITDFNDVTKLSQDIRHIIDRSNRKQRLDVVLPYSMKSGDPSKEYFTGSERLRLLHRQLQWSSKYNELGIGIHFDGCEWFE